VLDKYGLSQTNIIDLVAHRDRGIISVRGNAYGWHGPWSHLSGWQPVSDADVGISHAYGKALGLKNDAPVTPLFPTSDYSTGVIGVIGVLSALIQRGKKAKAINFVLR
jgi:crotonobetainyl-CoA:carnitine CoA-transferase CaiB-like acyl-CoA transferase